jgi:hypothetical protein
MNITHDTPNHLSPTSYPPIDISLQYRQGLIRHLWNIQKTVISRIGSSRGSDGNTKRKDHFSSSSFSASELKRNVHDGEKDIFSSWAPFALCSVTAEQKLYGEKKRYTVVIHPVNGGRFAVPILLCEQITPTLPGPCHLDFDKPSVTDVVTGLWDFFDLRHYEPADPEDNIDFTLTRRIFFFQRLISLIDGHSITSFEQMIGTLVLWRTIKRCLGCYALKPHIRNIIGTTYSEWKYCVDELHTLQDNLKRSVENSKENSKSSARWKRALEITGY